MFQGIRASLPLSTVRTPSAQVVQLEVDRTARGWRATGKTVNDVATLSLSDLLYISLVDSSPRPKEASPVVDAAVRDLCVSKTNSAARLESVQQTVQKNISFSANHPRLWIHTHHLWLPNVPPPLPFRLPPLKPSPHLRPAALRVHIDRRDDAHMVHARAEAGQLPEGLRTTHPTSAARCAQGWYTGTTLLVRTLCSLYGTP